MINYITGFISLCMHFILILTLLNDFKVSCIIESGGQLDETVLTDTCHQPDNQTCLNFPSILQAHRVEERT